LQRRDFLIRSSLVTTGLAFRQIVWSGQETKTPASGELFRIFANPPAACRPFVRWWWNGDMIEKQEIARELRLLVQAGFGGVEINPIKFPPRTNDLGKRCLKWLSPEWVDMLQFTAWQAASLGLTCDLIVRSGWPFGADWLQGAERTQMVSISVMKLEGPGNFEVSRYELFREADPAVTSP
jgi:hypothetical protein